MKRIIISTLAALLLVLGISSAALADGNGKAGGGKQVVATATAQAGTLIYSKTIAGVGELDVYWYAPNNIAYMRHIGAAYGVATYTQVTLCTTDRSGGPCYNYQPDTGTGYRYYAGPVSVYAPNTCVKASGSIKWNGVTWTILTGPIGCG